MRKLRRKDYAEETLREQIDRQVATIERLKRLATEQ